MSKGFPRNRRPSLLGGAKRSSRVNENLFESFFVISMCGIEEKKPKTLFQYPPNIEFPYENEVKCFSLPEGEQVREFKRSSSCSSLNSLLFGQLSNLETSSNSFIFILNTGEILLYGICVHSEELLDSYPSFVNEEKQTEFKVHKINSISSTDSYLSGIRSYCMISQYPFFSAHFGVLYSLLAHERLYMLQRSTEFILTPCCLKNEKKQLKTSSPQLFQDNHAIKLLSEYYNKQFPLITEDSCKFSIGIEPKCEVNISCGTDLQLISQWAIPCLFRCLSLKDIFSFYSAILLETSVIIISENPGILSGIILSVIPLIYPLVWQGPLITILPSSLSEMLEAPVPLIVGMKNLPKTSNRESWMDPLIINLNTNKIELPKSNVPILPYQKKLMSEIKKYYDIFHKSKLSHSNILRKCSSEEKEAVDNIMSTFRKYNTELLDNDLFLLVTDNNKVKTSMETIFKSFPRKHQSFMRKLVETQQYSVHALHKKHSNDENNSTSSEIGLTLQTLDKLISEATNEKKELAHSIAELKQQLQRVETRLSTLKTSKAKLQEDASLFKSPLSRTHRRNKSWFA